MPPMPDPGSIPPPHPSFREALAVWVRIGLLSFGGPTGQIALMHRELVERRRWISDRRFLHALNYCMLLPGPEAHQLAIYTGWLLHGTRGGLAAGILFVLPGALLLWGISLLYVGAGNHPLFSALFYGLKPAVIALVAVAVLRIAGRTLRGPFLWSVAASAFVAIALFHLPFPLILLTAGFAGWIGGKIAPGAFPAGGAHGSASPETDAGAYVIDDRSIPGTIRPMQTVRTAVGWSILWLAPVFLCLAMLGGDHLFTQLGAFFTKAALLTVGGAYAVLPYVAQQAVETHGWLSPAQMMDGLGLAETTPGPLILVLQFVGFLAGWNAPGAWNPWAAATLAAALTTWVTFLPGFLFIFVGAPYIERGRGNLDLHTALSAITAAVVGVVLNLGVWFAWNVVRPASGGTDLFAAVAALIFFFLLHRKKLDVLPLIALAAITGWVWKLLTGL